MGKLFITISMLCFASLVQAQVMVTKVDSLTLLSQDERIDKLIAKQREVNERTTRDQRRTASGFRLQIVNTRDRNEAIAAKTKIYQSYPELKAYIIYKAPYFILRAGNFLDRLDAERYQRQMGKLFSNGIFIVRDVIEVDPNQNIDSNTDNP